MVFGWGILARGLIEIVPVARDKVVETSDDAVLVVDRRGRVVDANPMARQTLEEATPSSTAAQTMLSPTTGSTSWLYRRAAG